MISPAGEMIGKVEVPEYPEIMGMQFSKNSSDILFVTENSSAHVCLRVLVNNDLLEKTSKHKRNQIEAYE